MIYDQAEFEVRCEWGVQGLRELEAVSDVIVIVDVLSFTTAVDVATGRGGAIFPYPVKGESAAEYAASMDAKLASTDRGSGFSLSPASLRNLPAGYRLVLPSLNGAALSYGANHPIVLAACLRNAAAVARAAAALGSTVAVIPAGEMWAMGELRPSLEDWVGAGAVIAALPPPLSRSGMLGSLTRSRACGTRTSRASLVLTIRFIQTDTASQTVRRLKRP
jgi:2-phosphosulfolactate phosphatase